MEVIEKLFAMDTEAKDQCSTQVGRPRVDDEGSCVPVQRSPGGLSKGQGDRELATSPPPAFSLLSPALPLLTLNLLSPAPIHATKPLRRHVQILQSTQFKKSFHFK